ncbi:MAG: hypothetical protein IJH31_00110 [Erysipelotrichaceae bacterium]|nr:hypothetical protein [Erysipelotrichaceae bacterium]
MKEGYIRLDRNLLKWGWKDIPEMVALWIEILLQANYQEQKWHGETYEVGSFPTSIEKLAKSTGLSAQQVRTCLNRLKSTNEITITSTSKGTKISVNNWGLYQQLDNDTNKLNNKEFNNQSTSHQQAVNKRLTTLKERNKEINIIKEKNIKKEKPFDCVNNLRLKEALNDFEEMRKKIKSPLTLKAQEIILKKLDKLAFSDNEKIEIINQSIENGWKSIYPLVSQRQEKNRNEEMPIYDESVNREFTSEMRQQLMERRNKEL